MEAVHETDSIAIVTADHGNADQLWDTVIDGPHTAHTLNPVEVVIIGKGCEGLKLKETGRLGDLAPTILELMKLEKPENSS